MQTLAIPPLRRPAKKDKSEIGQFIALVQQGVDAWTAAGKKLVVMVEKNPGAIKEIQILHPDISWDMLATFERIGRKQIYAPLLANNSMAAHRLLEMPYDLQERYCKGKIEVVVKQRDGTFQTSKKLLHELSMTEIKQVFGFDEVRNVERQIKLLKEREKTVSVVSAPSPVKAPASIGFFKIIEDDGGKLRVEPCKDNGRAHYTRAIPTSGGWETVIHLFKPTQ